MLRELLSWNRASEKRGVVMFVHPHAQSDSQPLKRVGLSIGVNPNP